MTRISALERQQKEDMATIDRLHSENFKLKEDLEKLREANRAILKNQQPGAVGEIHYLYQDLFLTDMKRQVDSASDEVLSYRTESEAYKQELEVMRRDYGMMQATLRRYRELVAAGRGASKERDFMDSSSYISSLSEVDQMSSIGKSADSSLLTVPRLVAGQRHSTFSVSKAEELEAAYLGFARSKNLKSICNELAKAARTILNCKRCTLFLLDRQASETHAGRNEKESKKLNMGKFWATFHIERGAEIEEPQFTTLEEAKKGARNSDLLMHSVCLEDRVLITIQCTGKIAKGRLKGFTSIDELLVRLLGHVVKVHVQMIFAEHTARKEREHTMQVVTIASELAMSRTHQELANQASKLLTEFFEFETAGLVFVDPYQEEFFMMAPEATGEGYSKSVIRFPKSLGLTGEVYTHGSILQIDDVKKNVHYNPEIDNVSGSNELISLMIGVIPGPLQRRIGVLQLGNKSLGQPLGDSDLQKFNALAGLLGACMTCTNDLVQSMSLTINLKDCINTIITAVDSTDSARSDIEAGQLFTLMNSLKGQIVEWSHTKKQKMHSIFS
jgi:hypothetical protein